MRLYILLLFVCIIFSSCNKQGSCLHSPDDIKTENHKLEKFNNITINSMFDVTLVDTNSYSISITTHENILPFIKYEVKNNELIIDNTSKCLWLIKTEKPKIIISTPTLDNLNVYNACDLRSNDSLTYDFLKIYLWSGVATTDLTFNCRDLWFKATSITGDYYLRGKCFYSFISNIGSGYLHANTFQCEYMDFEHSSLGNSNINVTVSLNIENIKYGNVYLFTENCPRILYKDENIKKHFSSNGCLE